MEVELISLDSPRLTDAVLPVSSSQNELEGIRIDPDPLWDEEGEAYAGWTQVDNRFPPMSKLEADQKMDEGEDLEEEYEQFQVSYGCGCCSRNVVWADRSGSTARRGVCHSASIRSPVTSGAVESCPRTLRNYTSQAGAYTRWTMASSKV
jgi:hypothetical protein